MPLEIFDEIRPRKDERGKLRWSVLFGIVCLIVLFVAAAWPTKAHAAPVFRAEQDGHPVVLRLLEQPCTDEKVTRHIRPMFIPMYKAAKLSYGGKDWSSCWVLQEGAVYSIDEEGAPLQPIPARLFKEESV